MIIPHVLAPICSLSSLVLSCRVLSTFVCSLHWCSLLQLLTLHMLVLHTCSHLMFHCSCFFLCIKLTPHIIILHEHPCMVSLLACSHALYAQNCCARSSCFLSSHTLTLRVLKSLVLIMIIPGMITAYVLTCMLSLHTCSRTCYDSSRTLTAHVLKSHVLTVLIS